MTSFLLFFFFFKKKTAYEMRISDWSSDVCSSDLPPIASGKPQDRKSKEFIDVERARIHAPPVADERGAGRIGGGRGDIDAVQRAKADGAGATPCGHAERHQARRSADAGEPVVRSLFRHAVRRARLWRLRSADAVDGQERLSSAGPGKPGRLSAAVPSRHPPHHPPRNK